MKRRLLLAALAACCMLPARGLAAIDGFEISPPPGFTVTTPGADTRAFSEGVVFAAEKDGDMLAVIRREASPGALGDFLRECAAQERVSYEGEVYANGARFALLTENVSGLGISVAVTERGGCLYALAHVDRPPGGDDPGILRSFIMSLKPI